MNYTLRKQNQHCDCHIRTEDMPHSKEDKVLVIEYCPKHKAAPDMYEALKVLCDAYVAGFEGEEMWNRASEALAKAEGREK